MSPRNHPLGVSTFGAIAPVLMATVIALTPTPPAIAGTINWTLQGVTFQDGATASGTFTTDDASGQLLDYDVFTTTTGGFTNIHWTPEFTSGGSDSSSSFAFYAMPIHTIVHFRFSAPLSAPGTNLLDVSGYPTGSHEEGFPSGPSAPFATSAMITGSAFGVAAVPELHTYAMLSTGLLFIGLVHARRKPR